MNIIPDNTRFCNDNQQSPETIHWKVGIYLPRPVFSRGLYAAASRAKSFDGSKMFVKDTADQARPYNDDTVQYSQKI